MVLRCANPKLLASQFNLSIRHVLVIGAQHRRLGTDTTTSEPRDLKAIGKDLLKIVDTMSVDQLKRAAEIFDMDPELLRRDDGKPLQPVRTRCARALANL